MSLPSNGITAEIIREAMPPYHLSSDLLDATIATLCPPPPGASAAWYEARVLRVTHDISTLMPANAAQAAMASDIVIVRYTANTLIERSHDRALTEPQMCRMCKVADGMKRTAGVLVRTLQRTQRDPAPFFGTVLADEVDVVAVAATWRERVERAEVEADVGPEDAAGERGDPRVKRPRTSLTTGTAAAAMAGSTPGSSARGQGLPAMTMKGRAGAAAGAGDGAGIEAGLPEENADIEPMQLSALPEAAVAAGGARPDATRVPQTAAEAATDARSTVEGVVTRLDQGLGWTLEVVRPRVAAPATPAASPMTTGVPPVTAGASPTTVGVRGEGADIDPMQLSALPTATTTAPGEPRVPASSTLDVGGGRQAGAVP